MINGKILIKWSTTSNIYINVKFDSDNYFLPGDVFLISFGENATIHFNAGALFYSF